jgi:hypothetical protein
MEKKFKVTNDVIICQCYSTEHQIIFSYSDNEDWNEVFMSVHLNKRRFWDRLKYGIKHILGYQCQYGAFDEFIFNPDNVHVLENVVRVLHQIKEKENNV